MACCTSARHRQGSPKSMCAVNMLKSGASTAPADTTLPCRAAQDELYLQQSIDACHDAIMRALGAIPALQHAK